MASEAPEASKDAKVFVKAPDAEAFVRDVLERNGVSDPDAAIVASCLVQADLREPRPFVLEHWRQSVAARGKIYKAKRRGEKIPLDWALDAHGNRTDDPAAALDGGVMLPMGGPKGSALALMMDVFSGVLSGSAFAGHVTNPYDPSRPADVGHFIMAIKPDLFMSLDEFKGRMKYLYGRVVGCEKMAGVDRIYFPGEIEQLTMEERLKTGIPYVQAEIDALNAEAELVGAKRIVESR
ncbi:hypothetical protein MAPG_01549 [Magnaporthiopsis poae ATCC 64411]|uniref:Malate/L-lactate dehydrogenase n=1 Tax=Magnaporthiopsis poae (strain ATCC 64411 / 73-15) TaxID=644358 RepID=A0A0C4DP00_MAGP6|nr:hypothetical protein MAPG_01549 [Magnaporthiopsis poae ATCC 64411]